MSSTSITQTMIKHKKTGENTVMDSERVLSRAADALDTDFAGLATQLDHLNLQSLKAVLDLEVSLLPLIEHCLPQLSLCQKLSEKHVSPFQLTQLLCFFVSNAALLPH